MQNSTLRRMNMFNLSPKNDKFFDLFIEYSKIIYKSTVMLKAFMEDTSNGEEKFKQIKDVEHEGDVMLHTIFTELNNSFITPLDREDIHMIGKSMDVILDFVEATASRFVMFNINSSKQEALIVADLAIACSKELTELMNELKNMKNSKLLNSKIDKINGLENEADNAFRKAVRQLFSGNEETIKVIAWKEIYECLENVIDACEDVANIVEGVVMKHA
jgi:predicted phosphate transport protein (TIGR00153 family)